MLRQRTIHLKKKTWVWPSSHFFPPDRPSLYPQQYYSLSSCFGSPNRELYESFWKMIRATCRDSLGSGGKPSTWFPPGKTRRAPRVNFKFPSIWEIFSFSIFFYKITCLMKVSNESVQASFQILCPRMCDWFTFPIGFLEQIKISKFSFFFQNF